MKYNSKREYEILRIILIINKNKITKIYKIQLIQKGVRLNNN